MNKDYENLKEITDLCKEELEKNDQNTTAILDIADLRSLNNILPEYKRLQKDNEELNSKILSNAGIYQLGLKDGEKEIKVKIESELGKARKELTETIELSKEAKTKKETTLWWTAQIRADERIKTLEELLKKQK